MGNIPRTLFPTGLFQSARQYVTPTRNYRRVHQERRTRHSNRRLTTNTSSMNRERETYSGRPRGRPPKMQKREESPEASTTSIYVEQEITSESDRATRSTVKEVSVIKPVENTPSMSTQRVTNIENQRTATQRVKERKIKRAASTGKIKNQRPSRTSVTNRNTKRASSTMSMYMQQEAASVNEKATWSTEKQECIIKPVKETSSMYTQEVRKIENQRPSRTSVTIRDTKRASSTMSTDMQQEATSENKRATRSTLKEERLIKPMENMPSMYMQRVRKIENQRPSKTAVTDSDKRAVSTMSMHMQQEAALENERPTWSTQKKRKTNPAENTPRMYTKRVRKMENQQPSRTSVTNKNTKRSSSKMSMNIQQEAGANERATWSTEKQVRIIKPVVDTSSWYTQKEGKIENRRPSITSVTNRDTKRASSTMSMNMQQEAGANERATWSTEKHEFNIKPPKDTSSCYTQKVGKIENRRPSRTSFSNRDTKRASSTMSMNMQQEPVRGHQRVTRSKLKTHQTTPAENTTSLYVQPLVAANGKQRSKQRDLETTKEIYKQSPSEASVNLPSKRAAKKLKRKPTATQRENRKIPLKKPQARKVRLATTQTNEETPKMQASRPAQRAQSTENVAHEVTTPFIEVVDLNEEESLIEVVQKKVEVDMQCQDEMAMRRLHTSITTTTTVSKSRKRRSKTQLHRSTSSETTTNETSSTSEATPPPPSTSSSKFTCEAPKLPHSTSKLQNTPDTRRSPRIKAMAEAKTKALVEDKGKSDAKKDTETKGKVKAKAKPSGEPNI